MSQQDRQAIGSVEYHLAGDAYFAKRGLRRHARVGSLWALGVGAVISGDFFGWNVGLAAGGFGGMLIATVIMTVMYLGLVYSIAEMAPALPHSGGAYSFGRSAMGPWGGFITGLAQNMEYVLTPAVIVFFMATYLQDIFGTPDWADPIWWAVLYVIFVGLNIWGAEVAFRFAVIFTLLALAILAVFYIGAIGEFDVANLNNMTPDPAKGGTPFLPNGWSGMVYALPFAIWFYLAIEELPLASEESQDPQRDMPKGITLALFTLIVTGFLVLVLNTGIGGGAAYFGQSEDPLLDGFKVIFGGGAWTKFLGLIAVAGLIASFHTIIYAYGRNIYSLSRAGYFPHWLSVTHGERKTPHVALIAGGVLGFVLTVVIDRFQESGVGFALLNMAVFGAVIAYIMQCLSFIILRKKLPNIERPYRSPLGLPGAWIAILICAATLIALLTDPTYVDFTSLNVVFGAAIWFACGLVYFAVRGRKTLVYSPEEAFAVKHRGEAGIEG